ncbi:FAST kinase domain-containing protein 5, mitochondrial [Oryzias latipes]|uniref:FAST kinase domains 5 n=1 Tax=Oryzias latipes TaxID=8090 RepID=H2MTX6_ORYLA|nr:FAST kinase domain-containing protein 5, mitochondrial [Oryzias latipes]
MMAARVLCRHGCRVNSVHGFRKKFSQAEDVHLKLIEETDHQEEQKTLSRQIPSPSPYRLYYNPSSYYYPSRDSANSHSQTDDHEEEQRPSDVVPSFRQQSNRYSVSCSRHLSSSNKLLDLAFNKAPETDKTSVLQIHKKTVTPDVKVNPRAFLKTRPEYASTSLDLTQRPDPVEWVEVLPVLQNVSLLKGRMKPSDVSQLLAELSRLHADKMALLRSDPRFLTLLRYSVKHLRLFSLSELLEVLRLFVWVEMPSSHAIFETYEEELSQRAKQMTFQELLFAADLWRCIGRQVPQFLEYLYTSVHLHLGQINVPELVHLLYIIGEGRHCPKDLVRPLEQLLMHHLHLLHPEEVGTVCLGLFKSQTSVSESAVTRIVDRALSFVSEMSNFGIVNVLKYMRFSYLFHKPWLDAMAQEIPRRSHGMGVQGLMHVTLTCSALHYRNDGILSAVAERIPSLAPHCRSKDSCKLLWAFGSLGFLPTQSPGFYPSLTEALRQRKAEFQRYPEHLLTGLLGLVFISQFPEDLVALALSPEFVHLALKRSQLELKKDLLTLDGAVALELPQWTGPRLSRELREEVAEMLWTFAQSDVCQKPEVVEAETALQDLLGGEQFVCKRMILPHTRSIDLEVHLDSTGQPIPVLPPCSAHNPASPVPSHQDWEKLNTGITITDELIGQLCNLKTTAHSSAQSSIIKPPSLQRFLPDEGEKVFESVLDLTSGITEKSAKPISAPQDLKCSVKVAIQVPTRNHYCTQSQQLLGLHAMKRRHLKLEGFKVVELGFQEWSQMLRKSRTEKLAYLHCKIYDCL